MRATKANIRRVMSVVTPEDMQEGMSWYEDAYGVACKLTPANPSTGAGILAALSPMTSWPENVKKATMVVDSGTTYGLSSNVDKAVRILNGETPLDVLRGPKVRSFYTDIMGLPTETVTIDRHAIDIACGRPLSNSERATFGKDTKYAMLARFYTEVAREYDVTPSQLQAITWVWWREHRAQANHGRIKP